MVEPREQINEVAITPPVPKKTKIITNKYSIIFSVVLLIAIPFIILYLQPLHAKPQPVDSSNQQPPQFGATPPTIKIITVDTKALVKKYETDFDMDYDILFYLENGHYLLDLEQPATGTAFNKDLLIYDGKKVIDTNLRDFMLSRNGKHYAFTTINEMTTGYPSEKITLYVDGIKYSSDQSNLKLFNISNDGKQFFYTTQPDNSSGKGTLYDAKRVIQTFSGINYDDARLLSDLNINSNGTFYSYNVNNKTYLNGKYYRDSTNINPIVFSDDYKHFLYLEFHNTFPVGSDAKLYVDNNYQFEGNMEYLDANNLIGSDETNPEIDNNGKFALLESDGAGGGKVYLQSKPYKLKGESDHVYFNPAQTHLLIHYLNGTWELDDKIFTMPDMATSSAVELENNYLYIYNITK